MHDDLVLSVALACWTAERYYESSEIKAHEDEIQRQLDDEFGRIMGDFDL